MDNHCYRAFQSIVAPGDQLFGDVYGTCLHVRKGHHYAKQLTLDKQRSRNGVRGLEIHGRIFSALKACFAIVRQAEQVASGLCQLRSERVSGYRAANVIVNVI